MIRILSVLLALLIAGGAAAADGGKKKPAPPGGGAAANPFAGLRFDIVITTSTQEVKRDRLSFTATHMASSGGEIPYKVTPAGKDAYQFSASVEAGGKLITWQAKGTSKGLKEGRFTQGSILIIDGAGERTVWTFAPAEANRYREPLPPRQRALLPAG